MASSPMELDDGSRVHMPSPEDIVDQCQDNGPDCADHTEVHRRFVDGHLAGPETEKHHNDHIDDRVAIDQYTEDASNVKGPPHQLGTGYIDQHVLTIAKQGDFTRATPVEKQNCDNQVGQVDARYRHGDDTVQGHIGSNVDKSKKSCNSHGEKNGIGRNACPWGNLIEASVSLDRSLKRLIDRQ